MSDRILEEALLVDGSERMRVEDVMMPDPYRVPPSATLDRVAQEMAEEKYGSAVVQEEGGKVVGIFTTVDVCRALREVLQTFYPEGR